MSGERCGDNRFEIIDVVKNDLINSTNITKEELKVLDNILFRLWQCDYLTLDSDNEIVHQAKSYADSIVKEISNESSLQAHTGLATGFVDGYTYAKKQLIKQLEKNKQ